MKKQYESYPFRTENYIGTISFIRKKHLYHGDVYKRDGSIFVKKGNRESNYEELGNIANVAKNTSSNSVVQCTKTLLIELGILNKDECEEKVKSRPVKKKVTRRKKKSS